VDIHLQSKTINKLLSIKWLQLISLSIAGMILSAMIINVFRITAGPFELLFSFLPFQSGSTIINLAPVGEIKAYTHYFFQMQVTLLNIDPEILSASLDGIQDIEIWMEDIINEAKREIVIIAAQCLGVIFAGGAFLNYLFLPIQSKKYSIMGGGLAVIFFVCLILFTIIIPFDMEAFDNPQYEGLISAAPWVMNFFEDGAGAIKDLNEQFISITGNIKDLFKHLEEFTPVETYDSVKVLHVSDIHNNPAAIEFIKKVVNIFQIDLIIDTGDITDYGTPLEADLLSGVAEISVPYIFVPGNHDSPQVSSILQNYGVYVLDNESVKIEGLKIVGITDPAYYDVDEVNTPENELEKYAQDKAYIFEKLDDRIDILATHDPIIGEYWAKETPLILTGHTHIPDVIKNEDTILINAGTTGASGIRGLKDIEKAHYSMAIIYYNKIENENNLSLYASDLINVAQISGSFTLERFMFHKQER